eukprot:1195031-Prorocentrum_minimum.AAC.2
MAGPRQSRWRRRGRCSGAPPMCWRRWRRRRRRPPRGSAARSSCFAPAKRPSDRFHRPATDFTDQRSMSPTSDRCHRPAIDVTDQRSISPTSDRFHRPASDFTDQQAISRTGSVAPLFVDSRASALLRASHARE